MAAKTPNLSTADAGYVDPHLGIYGGQATATDNLVSVGKRHANRHGLKLSIFYFPDVDDNTFWNNAVTVIGGVVIALAWQPEDATDDLVGPSLSSAANSQINFQTAAAASNLGGWLWVYHTN